MSSHLLHHHSFLLQSTTIPFLPFLIVFIHIHNKLTGQVQNPDYYRQVAEVLQYTVEFGRLIHSKRYRQLVEDQFHPIHDSNFIIILIKLISLISFIIAILSLFSPHHSHYLLDSRIDDIIGE